MTDFKIQQIKAALKDLLKQKKMTYENVAEELECSVPTVKRILGDEELTLSRLLQFCEILDVNLTDLETMTKMTTEKTEKFTEAQEQFLAKNKGFLSYFIKLYESTPEQIAEKYKLNQRSTDKYLMGLEKHGLIKVNAKQKVKPAFKSIPPMGAGVLAKSYYENFIKSGADFFMQNISEGLYSSAELKKRGIRKGWSMNSVRVTEATYNTFINEQEAAFEAFAKLGSYEEKTQSQEKLKTALVLQAFTIEENDYKGFEILERSLGDITNI